ncbi:MAG: acyl--CoA ligase [Gemmatimonadetes bacterium]|nr:acyl--CoA ligase [Gemmatimonadota bacterium]
MNCADRLLAPVADTPTRLALWTPRDGVVTYAEFARLAAQAQAVARDERWRPAAPVLLLAQPDAAVLATVVGLMGLGIPVLFVEPWLPLAEIAHVLRLAPPQGFIAGRLGQLWGLRMRAVRAIPSWVPLARVARRPAPSPLVMDDLAGEHVATIAFSSGTTGRPKGLVRTHAHMRALHDALGGTPDRLVAAGPDLAIFPNFALLHIGSGRGALLVPPERRARTLRQVAALPRALRPTSCTCGPAVLAALTAQAADGAFATLRALHVGGASTDCLTFERAFARWPDAHVTHLYGGSEVEPAALADAREAVRLSRARGYIQTLALGAPHEALRTRLSDDGLWVSGPTVAPAGIGEAAELARTLTTDAEGRTWRCTGDRIAADADGWWFAGRASQPADEFALEQRIYAALGTTACFVARDARGRLGLYGEGIIRAVRLEGDDFARAFPEVDVVRDVRIARDRRHGARIDRSRSLALAEAA